MQGAWKISGLGRISYIHGQKLFVSLNGIWETEITIPSKPIYRKIICMAGMEGLLKTIKQSQIPGKQLRLHSAFAELAKSRSVNKSDVVRKTGISKARLSGLTLKKAQY